MHCNTCRKNKSDEEFYKSDLSIKICKSCRKNKELLRYQTKKDEIRTQQNTYYEKYYEVNRSKILALKRKNSKNYYSNHKATTIARTRKRQGLIKQATPSWANLDEMNKIYKLAEELSKKENIKYHVDHVIPLNNELVCGLHNEFNLQILKAFDNLSKGNKFDPSGSNLR